MILVAAAAALDILGCRPGGLQTTVEVSPGVRAHVASEFHDLGPLGEYPGVLALTEQGCVLGAWSVGKTVDGRCQIEKLSENSRDVLARLPQWTSTYFCYGCGVCAGAGHEQSGHRESAYFWDGAHGHDLGTLGGLSAQAIGANAGGVVVGAVDERKSDAAYSPVSREHWRAFRYDHGAISLIPLLMEISVATGINAQGTIIGIAKDRMGRERSFVWSGSHVTFIHEPSNMWFRGTAINALNQIGGDITRDDHNDEAAVWANGRLDPFGGLGGRSSSLEAMNDLGWAVGTATTAAGTNHAYLWRTGKMLDLNTVPGVPHGVTLYGAVGLNNAGQILVLGGTAETAPYDPNDGRLHMYVLSNRIER